MSAVSCVVLLTSRRISTGWGAGSRAAPGRLRGYEPTIAAIADELIDGWIGRGACEFKQDFADPLPMRVVCELLALPREGTPGSPDQKGWRLAALLDAAGVKSFAHLVLSDASGNNLTLEKADLSDTSVPFIKLNKQGALRFRVLKKAGDGWTPSGDLRGLVAIDAK